MIHEQNWESEYSGALSGMYCAFLAGDGVTISSWGWLDTEGAPCSRNAAAFRLWSVRSSQNNPSRCFLAMPVEMKDVEVLILAFRLYQKPLAASLE